MWRWFFERKGHIQAGCQGNQSADSQVFPVFGLSRDRGDTVVHVAEDRYSLELLALLSHSVDSVSAVEFYLE